jgi:hypothetical protein
MKIFLSISLIVAFHLASSQQWEWARQITPDGSPSQGKNVSVDKAGNVYMFGYSTGGADFGSGVTLSGTSTRFIAKYDSKGNILWAKNMMSSAGIGGMALDDSANIYLIGTFNTSPFTIGTTTLNTTSGWDTDVFVAKFDSSGAAKWAKKLIAPSDDDDGGIAIDKNGNIYLTGFYAYDLTYGSIYLNANGNWDAFLLKLDRNGNEKWGRQVRQTSVATNNRGRA